MKCAYAEYSKREDVARMVRYSAMMVLGGVINTEERFHFFREDIDAYTKKAWAIYYRDSDPRPQECKCDDCVHKSVMDAMS